MGYRALGYRALIRTAVFAALVAMAAVWQATSHAADQRLALPQVAASEGGSNFVPLAESCGSAGRWSAACEVACHAAGKATTAASTAVRISAL